MSGVRRLTLAAITQGKTKGKALVSELAAMNAVTPKKNDKSTKKK